VCTRWNTISFRRELYEFPDWPLPKEAANFTPGPAFQKYLADYARHFGVLSHIRFGHAVLGLEEQAGPGLGWRVTYCYESEERTEDFDFAVVCVGLYSETPNIPFFEGRDQFKGECRIVESVRQVGIDYNRSLSAS
jgi:cation diffusion facilitator CzcD-associated flavoprotein CzcO